MKSTHTSLIAIAALMLPAFIGQAGDYSGKALVLNDKEPSLVEISLNTRLRYEYGELNGLDVSHAWTVRNRLGLLSRKTAGFQAYAEYEGNVAADRDQYFAPGTEPATGQTPIADAESHELNQAWVSYTTMDDVWGLKVGRQAINLDGQRFIGTVGWRQNMQTYDAATLTWNPNSDLSVLYSYVSGVERIFGSETVIPGFDDFEGSSHLFNAKYKGLPFGILTGYVYSLDLHNGAGDANSSDTFGFSLAGEFIGESAYYLEYAYQTNAYSNPNDYAANYVHTSLAKSFLPGVKTTVGYEYLGSDNRIGFATPLGTLHKFNGFADQFLTTPASGLSDAYLSVSTKLAEINFAAAYHYFWDDGFDVSLGQEIDLIASKALTDEISILAKAAFYDGMAGTAAGTAGFPALDATRFILEMNINY
ncbi:MAG: alginate export family protein [Verrucomicrobiales bacterium]|nr:alginate export family protein [Verrucomicrobiales bacterium]